MPPLTSPSTTMQGHLMSATPSPRPLAPHLPSPDIIARLQALCDDDAHWAVRGPEVERLIAEREQRDRHEAWQRQQKRLLTIPQSYLEPFDPSRAHYPPEVLRHVQQWDPGETKGKGIGLVGPASMGKTRLLVTILRRLSVSWMYLPAVDFSRAVAEIWSDDRRLAADATDLLESAANVRVLLLADIGEERRTRAVSERLKHLLEIRTSDRRPILWTSSLTPPQMRDRHGHLGPGIVRRLSEFCWTP